MQIEMNAELAELRAVLRRFTTEKLEPLALEIDRTGEIPEAAVTLLRDHGYRGVLSIECEGQGGPMIEQSLRWLRGTLQELGIPEDNQPFAAASC